MVFRETQKRSKNSRRTIFWDKEKSVDFSDYGLRSNKSVCGLIEILKNYHFTIDESTPIDEVALDPELLGKVFEKFICLLQPRNSNHSVKSNRKLLYTTRSSRIHGRKSLFNYLNNRFVS